MSEPFKNRVPAGWLGVAALAALALGLRLIYLWQVSGTSMILPHDLDPAFYYEWAKEIAAGDWLGADPFVQSPLYAYLLAPLIAVVGDRVMPILVVQALVGCGTVLLTYLAGRRLFDHRRGLIAGALVAIYGPFIFYEGMVMKTFLSPFLTILLVLVLVRARERAETASGEGAESTRVTVGAFALAGVVFGLLTLDRDNFVLLAPVMAGLALVLGGGPGRRGWRAAGVFTIGAVLVIAPVTLRNWAVSHEFVLLTTGGGEVFFIGNNADANGLYVPPPFVRPDPRYEHADFLERASEITGRPLSPMESSWFWFRQGSRFILEHPLDWCVLLWRKLIHFWNAYELPDNLDYIVLQGFSPLLRILNPTLPPPGVTTLALPAPAGWLQVRLHLFATFGTVAPLGLLGLYLTRGRYRRLLPLYVLLFGYMATVLLFFNFSRFRVPVVPILALFAAEGLVALGGGLRRASGLAIAFARRSGEIVERARALRPQREQMVAGVILVVALVGINLEHARGVLPAIERALVVGNEYYHQGNAGRALDSYCTGLVLLGEATQEPECGEVAKRHAVGARRRAVLLQELEVEAIARGPQYVGIHLGVHHGLGITMVQEAQQLLDEGRRQAALPLLDRAIAQFGEALTLAPAYLVSHRKMARAYKLKGDTPAAIEQLKKAADLWPDDLQVRMELAELLFDSREFRAALREMETAYRYNPGLDDEQLAQIHFNRALVFLQGLGDRGRALYGFEKAIELNPDHAQAEFIRSAIEDLRGTAVRPVPDEVLTPPPAATPPVSGG